MVGRLLVTGSLVLFLAGCATTGNTVNEQTHELQQRITAMETELEKKNQDISMLESELQRIQESLPGTENTKNSIAPALSLRQVQTALKKAGFYKGVIDGKTGPQTKKAIKNFQKANGLKADGIVGKKTALALDSYLQ